MTRLVLVVLSLALVLPSARADEIPPVTCKQPAVNTKISVSFSLEVEITELATWVMGFTCKNVVIDGEAKARMPRVTILAPRLMTPKQALELFVDAVTATGLVAEIKKDTIVITLGPKLPRSCPSVATPPTGSVTSTQSTTMGSDAGPSDDDVNRLLDAGIKRIDDTTVEVSKRIIDTVLANPMAFAKGARVVPSLKDGKPNGVKLYAVRPSSIFARTGLTNGDTLRKINGFELTSADKALEVYSKLREATSLVLDLERRGKPVTLKITIK